MDINNINASTAYTTHESVKPSVDSTLLKDQNQETQNSDINPGTARQQAFEVNITQEAQDLLAAEATQPAIKTPLSDNTSNDGSGQSQSPAAAQEARKIVNIVA